MTRLKFNTAKTGPRYHFLPSCAPKACQGKPCGILQIQDSPESEPRTQENDGPGEPSRRSTNWFFFSIFEVTRRDAKASFFAHAP
jgi:hypothetical protein